MTQLERDYYKMELDSLEMLVDRLRTGDGLESEFEKFQHIYQWIESVKNRLDADYKTTQYEKDEA